MDGTAVMSAEPILEASPPDALLRPGNTNCGGCGMSVTLQWLDEVLQWHRPYLVIPASCAIVTAGAFPNSSYGVPTVASTFASAAAYATGVSAVSAINDEEHPAVCFAGDGGTFDIGMATLSAAAERNENILYICYDNEIYGNTGGQRSSATPGGAITSTTPRGKGEAKKDIMAIMAAHRIPYAATLSIANRDDFLRKLQTARDTRGFRFLLVLSPCPTGWKAAPADSVELVDLAVRCGLFPLYEVFEGRRYRINKRPDGADPSDYLSRQQRFVTTALDLPLMKEQIHTQWSYLDVMSNAFPARESDY